MVFIAFKAAYIIPSQNLISVGYIWFLLSYIQLFDIAGVQNTCLAPFPIVSKKKISPEISADNANPGSVHPVPFEDLNIYTDDVSFMSSIMKLVMMGFWVENTIIICYITLIYLLRILNYLVLMGNRTVKWIQKLLLETRKTDDFLSLQQHHQSLDPIKMGRYMNQ